MQLLSVAHIAYGVPYLIIAVDYLDFWGPVLSSIFVLFGILNFGASIGLWLGRQWGREFSLAIAGLGVPSCVACIVIVSFVNWEVVGFVTVVAGFGFGPILALTLVSTILESTFFQFVVETIAVAFLGIILNLIAFFYLRGQTARSYLLKQPLGVR